MAVLSMKKKTVPIDSLVEQYDKLRAEEKTVKTRLTELSNQIKDYAQRNGEKDDKGSFYCENPFYSFGAQAATSVKLDTDPAIEYLENNGFSSCVKTKVVKELDEAKIDELLESGELSEEEFKQFIKVSTRYSVVVKKKEEVAEVEVTEIAASKRPLGLKKFIKGKK